VKLIKNLNETFLYELSRQFKKRMTRFFEEVIV